MNLNINVDERLIVPSVINLEQYSTSDTLVFELDKLTYGQIDLSVCQAFVVTQLGDKTDEAECTISGNLITWNVTAYTTQTSGTLTYQLRLVENNTTQWYSKKCVCLINSSIEADDYIAAMYPSILMQWKERMDILINEGVDENYLKQLIANELTAYTTTSQMNALLSSLETSLKTYADGKASAVQGALDAHLADKSNPHNVTLDQLNAMSKNEIAAAITKAIDDASSNYDPQGTAAQVDASLTAHKTDTTNPHSVTASQTGAYTKAEVDSAISTLNTSLSDLITALQNDKQNKAISVGGYTTVVGAIEGINAKVVNLLNGMDNLDLDTIKEIATAITGIQSDLKAVYKKTETYSKGEVDSAIANAQLATDTLEQAVYSKVETDERIATAKGETTAYTDTKVSSAITTAANDATAKANAVQEALNKHIEVQKEVNLSSAFTSRITASDETNSKYEIKDKSIAKVKSISGYSKKGKNILKVDEADTSTTSGVTFTLSNGTIMLNGTSATTFTKYFAIQPKTLNGGSYSFAFHCAIGASTRLDIYTTINGSDTAIANTTYSNSRTVAITQLGARIGFFIPAGETFTNYTIMPMLVEGATVPTTFEKGFSGIVNSTATKIVSTGENLWNEKIAINNVNIGNGNTTFSASGFKSILNIPCKPSNSYSINGVKVITYVDSNKTEISRNYIDTTNNYTFTTPLNCYYISVSTPSANKVMLNNGNTVSTYQEYASQELSIPSEVQALEGYGWGLSTTDKSLTNYIDYENKKFIQNVGRVDMGTLTYSALSGNNNLYYATITGKASGFDIICASYQTTTVALASMLDMSIRGAGDVGMFYIKNTSVENASVLKTALNGTELYYQLATPIETDISQYLTDDTYVAYNYGTETIDTDYPCLAEITYNADLDKQVVENADNIAKLNEDVASNASDIEAVNNDIEAINEDRATYVPFVKAEQTKVTSDGAIVHTNDLDAYAKTGMQTNLSEFVNDMYFTGQSAFDTKGTFTTNANTGAYDLSGYLSSSGNGIFGIYMETSKYSTTAGYYSLNLIITGNNGYATSKDILQGASTYALSFEPREIFVFVRNGVAYFKIKTNDDTTDSTKYRNLSGVDFKLYQYK